MIPGVFKKAAQPSRWALAVLMAGGLTAMSWPSAALKAAASAQGQGSQAEVQFEGEFEAIYEDGPSGSRLNHFLALDEDPGNSGRGNANGRRRIRLEFTDGEPDVETGTRIRARGRMKNASGFWMLPSMTISSRVKR